LRELWMVYDESFPHKKHYTSETYKNTLEEKYFIEIKYFRVNKFNKTGNVRTT